MSRTRFLFLAVPLVAFAALVSPTHAQAPCEKLLPDEIKACEGSDFCGVWGEAKWDGILPHCLAVEGSDGNHHAVYAWGRSAQWNIHSPGREHVQVHDTGDILKMKLGNGAKVEYELIDGQLNGYYYLNGGGASIVMNLQCCPLKGSCERDLPPCTNEPPAPPCCQAFGSCADGLPPCR